MIFHTNGSVDGVFIGVVQIFLKKSVIALSVISRTFVKVRKVVFLSYIDIVMKLPQSSEFVNLHSSFFITIVY